MEEARLRELLIKYTTDVIDKGELDELLDEVSVNGTNTQFGKVLEDMLEETEANSNLDVNAPELYRRIVSHRSFSYQKKVIYLRRWWQYSAAAVLLVAVGLGIADWLNNQGDGNQHALEIARTVTTSPSDRPLLYLADGRLLDLDSVPDGLLAVEGGIQITMEGDVLHYEGSLEAMEEMVPTNTIVVPKGRQYQITLQDGSKVWLNAASKLTYPIRFAKDRREVEVVGEAYLEVEHVADWPFVVTTALQQIDVLGTRFNVSAYPDDELTKTTLVEGRVNVSSVSNSINGVPPESIILQPGQQVTSQKGQLRLTVNSVDPEETVSWKDHLFVFNNEEVHEVMKKVSRWYDVEIEYLDGMAGKRIGGSIPRLTDVEELMEALKDTGLLRYKMKGGTIVVMK